MQAVQRAQGLKVVKLTPANEWTGPDAALADEQRAYWVALCGTAHGAIHVLLRRLAAAKGAPVPFGPHLNPYIRLLAEEGNRRVMAHGGWPGEG